VFSDCLLQSPDRTFDRVQSCLELDARQARFQLRQAFLQVAQVFFMLQGAALAFGQLCRALAGGGFDFLQCMIQRIGVEQGSLSRPRTGGHSVLRSLSSRRLLNSICARSMRWFNSRALLSAFSHTLRRWAASFSRLAVSCSIWPADLPALAVSWSASRDRPRCKALIASRMLPPGALRSSRSSLSRRSPTVRPQLLDGLRLPAGGGVHVLRGARQETVAFAVAALIGIQAAADAAQLFLDPAPRLAGLAFAGCRQRLLAVALQGGRRWRFLAIGRLAGSPQSGRVLLQARSVAQDMPGQPFADRKAFPPGSRPGSVPHFWWNTSNIPGEFCPHIESVDLHTRYGR